MSASRIIKHRIGLLSTLALLGAVAACQPIAQAPAGMRLPDIVVGSGSTELSVGLRELSRRTLLEVVEWDTVELELSNANKNLLAAPRRSAMAHATLAARPEATLSVPALKPGSGYSVTLTLRRGNVAVAAGTKTGLTLEDGRNSVHLVLSLLNNPAATPAPTSRPNSGGSSSTPTPSPSPTPSPTPTPTPTPSPTPDLTADMGTADHLAAVRVAGGTTGGTVLGPTALDATFQALGGLALDASGTIYMVDTGNHHVRKLSLGGGASVIVAGSATGVSGDAGDGGAAASAKLSAPSGLAIDPATGRLLVCDTGNNRIRRISSGTIATVAGGGNSTSTAMVSALNARLDQPFAVVSDPAGNIYFTERGSGRIRRIAPNLSLTTLATLSGAPVGPLAIDTTRKLLWVGHGAKVRVISGIDGGSPALETDAVFTAASGAVVTGLAFDQTDTLYASQADFGGAAPASARLWRLPVDMDGLLRVGRVPEALAGTGGSDATDGAYSVPTTAVSPASARLLAGWSWNSLLIDLTAANNPALAGGQLYYGNTHPAGWSQLVRFDPGGP